jgi:plasmid stabilization system protein ParE
LAKTVGSLQQHSDGAGLNVSSGAKMDECHVVEAEAGLVCIGAEQTKRLLRRGGIVGLNPASIAVDLLRLFEEIDEGRVDDLLLYRPDSMESVLHGFEDISSLFGAWLSVTRHNRRDGLVEALQAILDRFEVAEQPLRRAATALLILEPSHERAAQQLIRHYLTVGNVAAAMRVYQSLRSVLRDRFEDGAERGNHSPYAAPVRRRAEQWLDAEEAPPGCPDGQHRHRQVPRAWQRSRSGGLGFSVRTRRSFVEISRMDGHRGR